MLAPSLISSYPLLTTPAKYGTIHPEIRKEASKMNPSYAVLSNAGRYTKFTFKGKTITFMHGKDLVKYLQVKE